MTMDWSGWPGFWYGRLTEMEEKEKERQGEMRKKNMRFASFMFFVCAVGSNVT